MEDRRAPRGVDVTAVATDRYKFSDICAVGSKVLAAPWDAKKLLVYDVQSGALEGVDVTGVVTGDDKFFGICAVGSKVLAAPRAADKLLIYDVESGALEGVDVTAVAPACSSKFRGICAVGSKVLAAPYNGDKLMVYDVESGALEGVDVTAVATGGSKFWGICAVGSKVLAAPDDADKLLIYDVESGALEGVDVRAVATGSSKFRGICAVGSKVLAAPSNADKLLIYDVESRTLEGVDVSGVATGSPKFRGICAVGSKVLAAPCDADKLLIYDVESGALEGVDVSGVATGSLKFSGICAVGSKVLAAPIHPDKLLVYDMEPETPWRAEGAEHAADGVREALAIAGAGGGVPFMRGCLIVMGGGGQGKTCTVKALSGEPFDEHEASTPGTALRTCELSRRRVQLASGSPLKPRVVREGGEVTEALASHAARLRREREQAARPQPGRGGASPPAAAAPAPGASAAAPAGPPEAAGDAAQEVQEMGDALQEARRAQEGAETEAAQAAQAAQQPQGQPRVAAAAGPAAGSAAAAARQQQKSRPQVAKGVKPPPVRVDAKLLAEYAQERVDLTVSIFDCGGQDAFRSMHDIFQSGQSTYLLVFSLADAADSRKRQLCIANLKAQLNSIFVHSSSAPVLLVGTRSGGVGLDERLSVGKLLAQSLGKACPAFANLVQNLAAGERGEPSTFFAVENSADFQGSEQLKELALQIESSIKTLPSSRKLVPLRWLLLFDTLQGLKKQRLSFEEVLQHAQQCDLPHEGMRIEQEVACLLRLFHDLGSLFWFDIPELRDTVILDPQWILDGITCVIRTYPLHERESDKRAMRECDRHWERFARGEGRLHRDLLPYLWHEDRFKDAHVALLALMKRFGLLIPLRGTGEFMVPSLLSIGAPAPPPAECEEESGFLVHFGLLGAPEPDFIWYDADVRRGFMPLGVFHQLSGACIGWAQHTNRGHQPGMAPEETQVSFGRRRLVISKASDFPYVHVRLLGCTTRDDRIAVLERMQRLVADVVGAFYQNLRVNVLLPVEGAYVELGQLQDIAPDCAITLHEQCLSVEELREKLSGWLKPEELPPFYHAFISYRWGESDSPLTDKLVDCLSCMSLGNERLAIFQDKRRLRKGEQFDIAFMRAASRSLVIAPVLSWDALHKMTTLNESSSCDNVLLEWSLSLVLHKVRNVRVMPMMVGARKDDGSLANFFDGPRVPAGAARHSGTLEERFPDVVVSAVVSRLEQFARSSGIVLPEEARTRSVRAVVTEMLKFLGIDVADFAARSDEWGLHEALAGELYRVISEHQRSPEGAAFLAGVRGQPAAPGARLAADEEHQEHQAEPGGAGEASARSQRRARAPLARAAQPGRLLAEEDQAEPGGEGEESVRQLAQEFRSGQERPLSVVLDSMRQSQELLIESQERMAAAQASSQQQSQEMQERTQQLIMESQERMAAAQATSQQQSQESQERTLQLIVESQEHQARSQQFAAESQERMVTMMQNMMESVRQSQQLFVESQERMTQQMRQMGDDHQRVTQQMLENQAMLVAMIENLSRPSSIE